MTPILRTAAAATGLVLGAAALTACGSSPTGDDELTVVASTNVWGSVAQAVAGDFVQVESIIEDPSADPHSYEASPADAAALIDASLVVYNGGGYDHFVDDVVAGDTDQRSVAAFDLFEDGAHAGESHDHGTDDHDHGTDDHDHDHGHSHGAVNEHVWYDPATAIAVAHAVADNLAALDPANAEAYERNAMSFESGMAAVTDITGEIAQNHPGARVAQTEPIAQYLIEGAQLTDATPEEFQNAIENGTDPSPTSIAAARGLIGDGSVEALVYNIQTEDRVTQDLRAVAEQAGVPVVEVTETLPEGVDYIRWQTEAAQSLATALDR
ncbi:ABC transporter [Rhodococcus rhodnii LMG 5362]|uniref:ABC transporter n=1 Tax=Rhodococcus rhodnii LMG 5362 TaxID=1273125 RepID=R7WIZ2_9NOCA|nr:ABC transporter [Rhodococcus rhodnii LMG 5362]